MTKDWEGHLDRWNAAGLLDADSASRIRAWECTRSRAQGLGWPVRIALAFGAILLAAGVLLFVSAHWDELSPAGRMSLLAATVAVLHGCGAAVARRFEGLSVALHTVGSVALGAAIALAGQVFNLNEHWPAAVLLWAIGCTLAWLLLRHWTQGALCAILFPWWLAGEWDERVAFANLRSLLPIWVGICALSFAYLGARRSAADGPLRKALMWLGGLALLPAAAIVASFGVWERGDVAWGSEAYWTAWAVALLVPLLAAVALDSRRAGTEPPLSGPWGWRFAATRRTRRWRRTPGARSARRAWRRGASAMDAPSASTWRSQAWPSPCWRSTSRASWTSWAAPQV